MARVRGRPVENRWIGLRLSEPDMDLAGLAAIKAPRVRSGAHASKRSRPRLRRAWLMCAQAPWP
jgi:hypothetical protein